MNNDKLGRAKSPYEVDKYQKNYMKTYNQRSEVKAKKRSYALNEKVVSNDKKQHE